MLVLDFDIEGRGGVQFELHQPQLAPEMPAWACRVTWRGLLNGETQVFGATSLQSLDLATAFIAREMTAAFPGDRISQAGAPWFPH